MSNVHTTKRNLTIVQLAKQAGVSNTTVSRVINDRSGVSSLLRDKVQRVIRETGYKPPPPSHRPGPRLNKKRNVNQRNSKHRTAGHPTIGVVILDAHYLYASLFAARLKGIQLQAAEYGYGVQVFFVDQVHQIPDDIHQHRIEGLIFEGHCSSPLVKGMMACAPSIWSSSHHDPSGMKVLTGNYMIGRLAADYLLRRGHRQLGFLSITTSYPAFPARAEAFEATALRANAKVQTWTNDEPRQLVGTAREKAQICHRLDELVAKLAAAPKRVTGLFVPSDMMTCIVYNSLRNRDILPGRDIDIVSCNNEWQYLIGLQPQPATIDIGAELIGRKSMELLRWRIKHSGDDRDVHLAVEPVLIEPTD